MDIEGIAVDLEAALRTHNPNNYAEQKAYKDAIELLRSENPQNREDLSDLIELFEHRRKLCGPCRIADQVGWNGAREVLQGWFNGAPA